MGRYSNKFVLCILVNGQVQKDLANGEVHIPFGSEYSVRLRNKNDRRAVVDLVIDGESVGSFVVEANRHLDVKRWADKDVAFKFVDLDSSEAYDHGKQGPNPDKVKGTVEARFKLEKATPTPPKVEHIHHYHPIYPPVLPVVPYPMPRPRPWYDYGYGYNTVTCSNSSDVRGGAAVMPNSNSMNLTCSTKGGAASVNCSEGTASLSAMGSSGAAGVVGMASLPVNSATVPSAMPLPTELLEGCTVEGNKTGQKWVNVNVDTEDTETVLQLFLKGYAPNNHNYGAHVAEPPPQARPIQETPGSHNTGASLGFCPQCGKARQDKMHQFCSNCGNKF